MTKPEFAVMLSRFFPAQGSKQQEFVNEAFT